MSFLKNFQEPPHSYDFLATNTHFKEILARQVSPVLTAEGYQYDGGYQWLSSWKNHSRRIVQVRLLKGAGGEFSWGWCFDFIPVPSNDCKSCRYQWTDKSAGLQLFVWAQDLVLDSDWLAYKLSLFGADPEDVERRLLQVFQRSKPLGDAWFRSTQSPELMLAEAMGQSEKKNYHWPTPSYIQAFLLSALGQTDKGLQMLNAWFIQTPECSAELQDKLRKKLIACQNIMRPEEV